MQSIEILVSHIHCLVSNNQKTQLTMEQAVNVTNSTNTTADCIVFLLLFFCLFIFFVQKVKCVS